MSPDPQACLAIIDVQKGFRNVHTAETYAAIPELFGKYQWYLLSRFGNRPDSPVTRFKGWTGMPEGAPETELALDTTTLPPERTLVVRKSAFTALVPEARDWLAVHRIKELHLCGNDSDLCVTMTARDAMESGIRPRILARYCCSTAGEPIHRNALLQLKRLVGKEAVVWD